MPDAVLVGMDLHETFPDGHVDLTQSSEPSRFSFRSPERSNTDGICMVRVDVRASGVSVYVDPGRMCYEEPRALPSCPLTFMWEKARAAGSLVTHASASMTAEGWQFWGEDLKWSYKCP